MMKDMQTNISKLLNNAISIVSPFNTYLALGSVISNPSRMAQPLGGLGYIPQVMTPLTSSSLLSMRQ